MTPEEFEENVRIITGDPNWSLPDDEDNNVSNPKNPFSVTHSTIMKTRNPRLDLGDDEFTYFQSSPERG